MDKIKEYWERFQDATAIFIAVMAGEYDIEIENEEGN